MHILPEVRASPAFNREHNLPLSNLFVTMLQNLGVETETFASSTGNLNEITVK